MVLRSGKAVGDGENTPREVHDNLEREGWFALPTHKIASQVSWHPVPQDMGDVNRSHRPRKPPFVVLLHDLLQIVSLWEAEMYAKQIPHHELAEGSETFTCGRLTHTTHH